MSQTRRSEHAILDDDDDDDDDDLLQAGFTDPYQRRVSNEINIPTNQDHPEEPGERRSTLGSQDLSSRCSAEIDYIPSNQIRRRFAEQLTARESASLEIRVVAAGGDNTVSMTDGLLDSTPPPASSLISRPISKTCLR